MFIVITVSVNHLDYENRQNRTEVEKGVGEAKKKKKKEVKKRLFFHVIKVYFYGGTLLSHFVISFRWT